MSNSNLAEAKNISTVNPGVEDEDAEAKSRRNLRPLAQLFPYLLRYKTRVGLALIFLVMAATATLTLPLAVRRMIDQGFSARQCRAD